jgi:hypothetical protein
MYLRGINAFWWRSSSCYSLNSRNWIYLNKNWTTESLRSHKWLGIFSSETLFQEKLITQFDRCSFYHKVIHYTSFFPTTSLLPYIKTKTFSLARLSETQLLSRIESINNVTFCFRYLSKPYIYCTITKQLQMKTISNIIRN